MLFSKLHSAWCARSNQRQFPRRRKDTQVYCAFEPTAIYALMKRQAYLAPAPTKLYDHHEVANIYVSQGTAARPTQQAHTPESWAAVKHLLEVWQTQEESATGMSLVRLRGSVRVRHGQLVALRLGDAGVAMVAIVRWAEQDVEVGAGAAAGDPNADPGHTVEVGIQMLPGLARAGAVRFFGARAVAQAGSTAVSTRVLSIPVDIDVKSIICPNWVRDQQSSGRPPPRRRGFRTRGPAGRRAKRNPLSFRPAVVSAERPASRRSYSC